jgi:hypothetical protein
MNGGGLYDTWRDVFAVQTINGYGGGRGCLINHYEIRAWIDYDLYY